MVTGDLLYLGNFVVCSTSGHSLYQVLELPQTASAEDIKRAYRKVVIMLVWRPFVKRFALSYRTIVLSVSSVCL